MTKQQHIMLEARVPESGDNCRFDQVVAKMFDDYSRSRLQLWIKQGAITVDGKTLKAKEKVYAGQKMSLDVIVDDITHEDQAEQIELNIIHEDEAILVVNKPVGLVVHPAAGHHSHTLLNGLLHHCPQLHQIPRAGIVHRLDKDTSGLMVVAKTLPAHNNLVAQLQERTVSRHYYALVQGKMTAGGTVRTAIGRHPANRKKQAVLESGGKEAITHYRVQQRFRQHTLVKCQLETGRTHQIRVHMAHIRYPLVGDKLYGGRARLPKSADKALIEVLQSFPRQALHAFRLGLEHPETGMPCEWVIDIADDMQHLIDLLEQDNKEHS